MRPRDTSPEAFALQHDAFRRMAPSDRVAAAIEMSESVRSLAEAGIRQRHPEYSAQQVREALVEIMLGAEVAARVRAATGLP